MRSLVSPLSASAEASSPPSRRSFQAGEDSTGILDFAGTFWEPRSVCSQLEWLSEQPRFPLHHVDSVAACRSHRALPRSDGGHRQCSALPAHSRSIGAELAEGVF